MNNEQEKRTTTPTYEDIMKAAAEADEIEQQYIESFAGNAEAILEDVRQIVRKTTKKEYLTYQRRITETLKPLLEKKPGKDSTPETKKAYRAAKQLSVKGYTNCYYYILAKVRVQINALIFYGSKDGEAKTIAIVEDRTAEFYEKPKGAKLSRDPAGRRLPLIRNAESKNDLFTIPSSPAIALIYDVLSGGELETLPARKNQYNRNQQLLVTGFGDKRRVSYTTGGTMVSIEIDDFRKVVSKSPQAQKLLIRIFKEVNDQALHNGVLVRNKITFPLQDLVGKGQYKTLDTARQGYYNSAGIITGIKISGKLEHGKKKIIRQGGHVVLFPTASVDNATCEIYLNEQFNWQLIAPYYTALPNYIFELSDRAVALLEYIFFMARQNAQKIANGDPFYISYRAIQYKLNLPDETTNKNPKRDIKDAIEAAIEEIEETYSKYAPSIPIDAKGDDAIPDFTLLPQADYFSPIKKYLDEGRLQVSLKGDYAKQFIEISKRTAAKIEAARKRRERILDNAIAINVAKQLDEEKKRAKF